MEVIITFAAIIIVAVLSCVLSILIDNSEEKKKWIEKRKIHIYYVNRLKMLDEKLQKYIDSKHNVAIATCKRNQIRWVKLAGIKDQILIDELLMYCKHDNSNVVESLQNAGWTIIFGEENLTKSA